MIVKFPLTKEDTRGEFEMEASLFKVKYYLIMIFEAFRLEVYVNTKLTVRRLTI